MADYIGISKSLAVVGIAPKPEINYFYGPWESIDEALDNIPQLARVKGLTVGIIEGSEIVEYWFKNGVDLVLKLVDPESVYTTNEIQQIINDLENTYVQKEVGKVLIPTTSLTKLNQLPTKESNDNTYVAKEVGKSLIENSKITKLDSLPSSVYSQAEIQQIVNVLDTKLDNKVDKVTGSRLLTDLEANAIANAVTRTTFEERLSKKVDAVPGAGLITDSERTLIANAVNSATLSTELAKKVTAVAGSRLIREDEATKLESAVTAQELSVGLATKVDAVANQRLITEQEANRLASAVMSGDLESYSLKDTGTLEEIIEVPKEEKKYIKFFDEEVGEERKISLQNFILGVSTVYPTARNLVGEKNGSNETFTSEYNYIAGSEKLNINGSIYYPNSGFYMEDGKIILSGAPIPESGDFMFLEAIYLD